MEEALKKLLEKSIELAEKTGEFALNIAPELLQEFYKFRFFYELVWIIGSGVIVIVCIIGFLLGARNKYGLEDFITSFIIGFILSFIMFLISLNDLVKLVIAPKIYLLEYLANHF